MDATQSVEQAYKVKLKIMVDKERNKVLYIEAGKDFVDVLLSFLTLPLGTIARLVSKDSNIEAVRFGSLSSLYQSIACLDEQFLSTHTCKEMLLNPRNSMEAYCHRFKLNIDDTEPMQSRNCLNLFMDQKGGGGKVVLSPSSQPARVGLENGFGKENSTFIISDDLFVLPNVFGSVVHLHQKHKITNFEAIVEQNVEITKKEVVDILKLSLTSNTPLTDFIFKKKCFPVECKNRNQSKVKIGDATSDKGRQMSVKVVRQKSTGKVLFAEAGVDFIDFVFSFQTFPLGGVLHMLEGVSSLDCIDNLYNSMAKSCLLDIYLMSQNVKVNLSKPLVAAQFDLRNHILPIYAASNSSSMGKFAKGPSVYMVTDDLVVTPMSSFNAISYLNSLDVPLLDVEERVVKIGVKEGLSILKASLTSASALTDGLSDVSKLRKLYRMQLWMRSLRLRSIILIGFVAVAFVGNIAATVEEIQFKF